MTHDPSGILYDIPYDTYAGWDAVRSSALLDFFEAPSPAHFLASLRQERKVTDEMRLGTAVHLMILEPDKEDDGIVISPVFGRKDVDKEAKAAFHERNKGKVIVAEDEYETLIFVREAVLNHRLAAQIIEGALREVSLLWVSEEGARCKARTDLWNPRCNLIADLKTTGRHAGTDEYRKKLCRYYQQQAYYKWGFRHLDTAIDYLAVITVEMNPPYGVIVYEPPEEDIALCEAANTAILRRFIQAKAEYESYPDDKPIEQPLHYWDRRRLRQVLDTEEAI